MIAVMVGGPLHGQTKTMPRESLPHQLLVPRAVEISFSYDYSLLEPHRYSLRWYQAQRTWTKREQEPAYLCTEVPSPIQLSPHPTEDEIYYARVAESLWHHTVDAALPGCVVPDCKDKGRMTFTAAENGRLASRDWKRGDEIRLCPNHGCDVYRAQGAYGMAHLAEWLRPDATWDALDAYDILYGAEILERTARMLRLAQPARGEQSHG